MRDAESTKTAILDAAEVQFARCGLLGARTEDIAEAAGVTRAMIHYYYNCKEQLYQEVLERAFGEQVRIIQNTDVEQGEVTTALRDFLRAWMTENMGKTNLVAILLFEGIQNDGRFYKKLALASIYQPLAKFLERGMREGKFRKLDPLHASINIVGLCIFYLCARNNVKHLFPPGSDLLSAQMLDAHINEAVQMMMTGVLKTE